MKNSFSILNALGLGLLALAATSCGTTRQAQLEAVAKDWCSTIRASQVIPVYPLTEDLEPGDIFLVESPVADQRLLYKKKGYLPFENHLGRMNPGGYSEFYRNGYGVTAAALPPRHWQFPNSSMWTNAPIAGFPTYTFHVKSSQGLSAAFPISGVPVSLGILGASDATGTVSLKQTHTYGLDEASMARAFNAWVDGNAKLLRDHASTPGHPRFLRVVTRVYVVKEISVQLTADRSVSGAVKAGLGGGVDLYDAKTSGLLLNYSNSLATLEKTFNGLSANTPGGAAKFASASSRSIGFDEKLERPVVVGYLAQEYLIDPDGDLGPSMSTREILELRLDNGAALLERAITEEKLAADSLVQKCIKRIGLAKDAATFSAYVQPAVNASIIPAQVSQQLLALARTDLAGAKLELGRRLAAHGAPGILSNRCQLDSYLRALPTK